jgi:hypothetical protein
VTIPGCASRVLLLGTLGRVRILIVALDLVIGHYIGQAGDGPPWLVFVSPSLTIGRGGAGRGRGGGGGRGGVVQHRWFCL